MKILIDINHPAHVHYFRDFTKVMQAKGHSVLFTCRDKDVTLSLLKHYQLEYICLGKHYKSTIGKIFGLFKFTIQVLFISIKYKADMFVNASIYSAITAWLMKKPHIALEDTGNMEQVNLYKPFTNVILTPKTLKINLGEKQIRYEGYQELLYINKFNQYRELINEQYVIIRLVSWSASHDVGQKGISDYLLDRIVNKLKGNKIKIIISCEGKIPKKYEEYSVKFEPHLMLNYLSNARLFIGEGATMAMESAILGTPAIYINSLRATNCEDVAKHGLCLISLDDSEIIAFIDEILEKEKGKYIELSQNYLDSKIDVASFLVWFVEKYPESVEILKKDPNYQLRFK